MALDNGYNKDECMFWIGNCYENNINYDDAIPNFNQALNHGYNKSVCFFLIGHCYEIKKTIQWSDVVL